MTQYNHGLTHAELDGDDTINTIYQKNVGLKIWIDDTTHGNASLIGDLRRKAL